MIGVIYFLFLFKTHLFDNDSYVLRHAKNAIAVAFRGIKNGSILLTNKSLAIHTNLIGFEILPKVRDGYKLGFEYVSIFCVENEN